MKTAFQWDDAFRLNDQLSDDERAVRDAAHQYCQQRLQPRVLMAARHEKFDREIMNELGELGIGAHMQLVRRRSRVACLAHSFRESDPQEPADLQLRFEAN